MQEGGAPDMGGMGDMKKMQEMFGSAFDAFGDPDMVKQMEDAMEMLSKMSPEDMEKQMTDAMAMLTDSSMMEEMMKGMDKGQLLKYLEESGVVPPEELAKLKADPEYFELKMVESFDQMKGLLDNPEVMKAAAETIGGLSELYKNPSLLTDLMEGLAADFSSDEKIEEARLQLLSNPDVGGLKEMFESEEMQDILSDPAKWRQSVKEGQGMLNQGAGVGEL
jgi:hypothetical protein